MSDRKTMEPEALAETAREVACQKVGECFTQGTDVLLIARAVKAAKYAYIAAATARDKRIAELEQLCSEHVPYWGVPAWDKDHDQDAKCACGHPYDRHFDGYEDNAPVGCKYCECRIWRAPIHRP